MFGWTCTGIDDRDKSAGVTKCYLALKFVFCFVIGKRGQVKSVKTCFSSRKEVTRQIVRGGKKCEPVA